MSTSEVVRAEPPDSVVIAGTPRRQAQGVWYNGVFLGSPKETL